MRIKLHRPMTVNAGEDMRLQFPFFVKGESISIEYIDVNGRTIWSVEGIEVTDNANFPNGEHCGIAYDNSIYATTISALEVTPHSAHAKIRFARENRP